MKLKLIITVALFYIITNSIISCKKTNSTNTDYLANAVCSGTTPTYTSDVASILNSNCATSGCHNSSSKAAGINLSDYTNAKNEFLNNSKNIIAIHHGSGADAMPKNSSKLNDATINKLDCWTKNSCPE